MFDEPEEPKQERALNPQEQAKEKVDEIRLHAELAAVYEGCRKFEAEINPRLEASLPATSSETSAGWKIQKARQPRPARAFRLRRRRSIERAAIA